MSRQLYDPVGVNGVAQHELLQITQNLTDGMSPKVFAGVAVDTHAGMVDLYLANTSPGARESAMATVAAAQRGLIRIHHVAMSETALNADMASTGTAVDSLLAARVPVQSYYPDFMGGRIVVRLYRPTAAQRARAAAAVASLPVRLATTRTAIVPVPPATAPARQGAAAAASGGKNRAFDKPAWTGGDFIDSTYSNFFHFCTDSWPIKIGSKQYITTAGHCSPSGHHWINMTLGRDGKTEVGDKRLIGVGSKNELKSSHHLDVQVLKTSNMADVWSGQVFSNYRSKVRKSVTPPVGAKICDDGAYEGTICGIKVNKSDYNSCIVSSDGKMCHLYRAHRPKQKVAIGQGDSGGPDYIAIGSTSHVRSVKGVGLNSLETVANMKCPHFTWRGKVCSNVMFFTGLSKILKLYRAKLRTTK